MSISHSYVKELENLVLDTLLPIYIKYQKSRGVLTPLNGINPDLLSRIKKKKQLPALLRPIEKQA